MSLFDAIADAELTVTDQEHRLVFAWFGGSGVNVYDEDGNEVYYFTLGGTSKLSPGAVRAAIRRVMAETVY